MHFNTIITSIAALGIGASAAPAAYTRYGQLRLYSEPGCSAQNLGELGVYDINQCKSFIDLDDTDVIRSVYFQVTTPGCTLHVYNDITCHLNDYVVPVGDCLSGNETYGSYELRCDL